MSDFNGRRGGGRRGYGGDRGRGRGGGAGRRGGFGERGGAGRGGGRVDFRPLPEEDAKQRIQSIIAEFRIGPPKISADPTAPDRPQYEPGSVGEPADFCANYFKIDCQLPEARQFSVDIDCEYNQNLERGIIEQLASEQNWPSGWVFDGRSALYTAGQILPPEEVELTVESMQGNRTRTYKVRIAETAVVPMSTISEFIEKRSSVFPAEAVRVLEVLLGHAVSMLPNVILHRKSVFFDTPDKKRDIGNGAEAWMGYFQSLRPCQDGLFLNIDSACGPFYKPLEVTDFIREILGLDRIPDRLSQQQVAIVKSVMKNMMVKLKRGNYRKKVIGILRPPADCMFTYRDQREMSVLEYYRSIDCQLRYPDLPCLDVSKGRKVCYVPPEYIRIDQAQYVRKITERHQESMIRFAAQNPETKEQYLTEVIQRDVNLSQMAKVQEFELSSASNQMVEVRGRILPPPCIGYKDPSYLYVGTQGNWNLGNTNMSFFRGKKLKSWALVSLTDRRQIEIPGPTGILPFLDELSQVLRKYNVCKSDLDLSRPPIVYTSDYDFRRDMENAQQRAREMYGENPDIILCLFPRRSESAGDLHRRLPVAAVDTRLYRVVKKVSDTSVGIPTQCFAGDKAGVGATRPSRGRPQYCANLALKINVKVGGTNSVLVGPVNSGLPMLFENRAPPNQRRPFMVFGCDVSHPSPGSTIPSIAAVVGSADPAASRYFSRITQQESREEVIKDMKESVKDLLLEFHQHTRGRRPESLIIFRDGVSEGHFSKVLLHEYGAIREACNEMGDSCGDYTPPITYIVIQKRHHTRIFGRSSNSTIHNRNIKPGTVIDTQITSPYGHDFFLCSQAGIQGTVRPAHYHVLVDENNYGANAIQIMCYWMCYMQCRCTRSISVPAPVHYAHLAALRARLIAGEESDDEGASIASGGTARTGSGLTYALSQSKMYYV